MKLDIAPSHPSCLKCGYVRQHTDAGPEYACPQCGAVYAKLEAARKAKLDAQARDEKSARNDAIRAEIEEQFDAGQRQRDADEAPRRMMAHAVYLMYALPFALTQISGLLLAYKLRKPLEESWLDEHFTWQIRTFWYLLLPSIVGVLALLVGSASTGAFVVTRNMDFLSAAYKSIYVYAAVAGSIVLVFGYRLIKGWYRLTRLEPPG